VPRRAILHSYTSSYSTKQLFSYELNESGQVTVTVLGEEAKEDVVV